MKLSTKKAAVIFREEADLSRTDSIDTQWEQKLVQLSELCASAKVMTHIAFFGTESLAKATHLSADMYAVKPKHAPDNPNAYSARSLCHGVLVPLAAELGVNIGVSGREPLNNMPYFRMRYLGDGTPVHGGAQRAFAFMLELVEELAALKSEQEARAVLRAFIAVRRRYQVSYAQAEGEIQISPEELAEHITSFVQQNSEGGRRAQAVCAGLFDVVYGPERVESGRINDPSRHYPGDVCISAADDSDVWEKAVEVRDKSVKTSDIQIFARTCLAKKVREAAVLMVAEAQKPLERSELEQWGLELGIGITLFMGWDDLVEQALFWADAPKLEAAITAVEYIEQRLISVEASAEALEFWQKLTRTSQD